MRFEGSVPTILRLFRYTQNNGTINDYLQNPRPLYTIAYMEKGGGEFQTPKGNFCLGEGDVLFVPVSSVYSSRWLGDPKAQFLSCHFSLPVRNPFARRQYDVQPLSGDEELHAHLCYLLEHWRDEGREFALLSHFFAVMEWVEKRVVGEPIPDIDPRLLLAVDYMQEHLEEGFGVEELAAKCHMSPSHFYPCFRRAFGTSPIAYKNRLAIRRAELLLCQDSSLSVERISELTGFSSASYFRRVFRDVTGKSPRQYRKDTNGGSGM